MGISAQLKLQAELAGVPLGWSLVLLFVFAMANPFDPSRSGGALPNLDDATQLIESGSVGREVALLALGIFAAITFLGRRRWGLRVNGLLGLSVLCYVALALASPAWAEDTPLTIRRVGVLLLLFLGALATTARYSHIQTAALAAYASGFTLLISLAVEIKSDNFHPFDGAWRFSGVLYAVSQGWNCGLLTLASLALAITLPKKRPQFFFLALVATCFLFLTRSRMPLLSTMVASAVLGTLASTRMRKLICAASLICIICISYVWLALFASGRSIDAAAGNVAAMGRGDEASSSLDTFTGRLPLWEEELKYAGERPILGFGYNAFLSPSHLASISKAAGWVPASPHSGYIGTILGLGCVGCAAFVLFLLLALGKAFRLARKRPETLFAAAVMTWLCLNLFLEDAIITEPTLPTFICLMIVTSLAFKDDSNLGRTDSYRSAR